MNTHLHTVHTVSCNPVLTHTKPICIVYRALAKSRARICTRQYTRRNSRPLSGFFFVADSQHVQFMTGWKGYLRIGRFPCIPVVQTFPVCHQSSFAPWVADSRNTRSPPFMAIYRLAVLTGNTTRLSNCTVIDHKTIQATSYRNAVAMALSLNALVISWRAL